MLSPAIMPASSRSLVVVNRLRTMLPHAADVVLGGVLELMIHSIEQLRDRFARGAAH
jgi:hypothetical protein